MGEIRFLATVKAKAVLAAVHGIRDDVDGAGLVVNDGSGDDSDLAIEVQVFLTGGQIGDLLLRHGLAEDRLSDTPKGLGRRGFVASKA